MSQRFGVEVLTLVQILEFAHEKRATLSDVEIKELLVAGEMLLDQFMDVPDNVIEDRAGLHMDDATEWGHLMRALTLQYLLLSGPNAPLPDTVHSILVSALMAAAEGQKHFLFVSSRQRGDKSKPITDLMHQANALRYIDLARESVINDMSFIKTVCDNYGVTPRTVRGWLNDERVLHVKQLINDIASYHGGSPDEVPAVMKLSGRTYRYVHGKNKSTELAST